MNTVGYVEGRLQLVIGDGDPIRLATVELLLEVLNGSEFATYSLKVDLSEVVETIRAIFESHGGGAS